jgi:hypothetical protein
MAIERNWSCVLLGSLSILPFEHGENDLNGVDLWLTVQFMGDMGGLCLFCASPSLDQQKHGLFPFSPLMLEVAKDAHLVNVCGGVRPGSDSRFSGFVCASHRV